MTEYENIAPLIRAAKNGSEEALDALLTTYDPLITKNSVVNQNVNADFYQELRLHFVKAVRAFDIDYLAQPHQPSFDNSS